MVTKSYLKRQNSILTYIKATEPQIIDLAALLLL